MAHTLAADLFLSRLSTPNALAENTESPAEVDIRSVGAPEIGTGKDWQLQGSQSSKILSRSTGNSPGSDPLVIGI